MKSYISCSPEEKICIPKCNELLFCIFSVEREKMFKIVTFISIIEFHTSSLCNSKKNVLLVCVFYKKNKINALHR